MASERIEERLKRLPSKPGCYLMKAADGTVLYVGKAASLKARVPSYFRSAAELSPKIRALVAHIDDFEYITVGTELEALITENSLVKKHKPKYNTLLKDDKTFPYIVITDEPFPRVLRTRRVIKGQGRYFGPFANPAALSETLRLLKKLFPYRSCALNIVPDKLPRGHAVPEPGASRHGASPLPSPSPANNYLADAPGGKRTETHPSANDRACLDYYIHRCVGPCIGAVTEEGYATVIKQVENFLDGKHDKVLDELEAQMIAASEDLQFERAKALRDQLRSVQRVASKQRVEVPGGGDQDVIGLARSDDNVLVQLLAIRSGKLTGRETFTMEHVSETTDEEVLEAFLQQYYDAAAIIPPDILVPCDVPEHTILEDWLSEQRGKRVQLEVPQRGDKKHLIELAHENALEAIDQDRIKWLTDSQKTAAALTELQEALGLPTLPVRLECFDISTIQGTSTVASMVVFENGKPRTDAYRRFRIKTVGGPGEPNDFAAMHEVLSRRLKRSGRATKGADGEESDASEVSSDGWTRKPDLIIVDGGKGQLNAALDALKKLGIDDQPIASLAKQNEELFIPGRSTSIMLPRTSQALYLVQRLRDEAHRFAITYHRNVRGKRALVSDLDSIHGIGGARKKALLRRFGSVAEIRRTSVDDIAAVAGIGAKLAESIKNQVGG